MNKTILQKLSSLNSSQEYKVDLTAMTDLIKITNDTTSFANGFNKTNGILKSEAKLAVAQAEGFNAGIAQINQLATALKKQFDELGLNYLDNENVKKAVALLNNSFNISQQAGYIKQIL